MMKVIIWILILVLLFFLVKRIGAGIVGILMFTAAIFFSIFMLDTFTVVNVRDYISVGFYDDARENPREAVAGVTDKIKSGGQSAVDKINSMGEKAQDRYNITSIVSGNSDEGAVEGAPATKGESKDAPKEDAAEKPKKAKVKKEKDAIPTLEGFDYYTLAEYAEAVKQYEGSMTERDYSIFKALTPLLTITYEGDEYLFHTERGVQGIYINRKG